MLTALSAWLTACGSPPSTRADAPAPLAERAADVLMPEGLSMNGLSMNGVALSGAALSALQTAGLSSAHLASNAAWATWAAANADAAAGLLGYVVRCALREGQSTSVVVAGVTHVFDGSLGAAPAWYDAPLGSDGEELVSACLMAHVNKLGNHVGISVRGTAPGLVLSTTAAEVSGYGFAEGAFYGNLFSGKDLHACGVDPAETAKRYGADGRLCATPEGCGFQYDGFCADVCSSKTVAAADDAAVTYAVFDRCGAYGNVVTSYLSSP